jgi:hypothetical protein
MKLTKFLNAFTAEGGKVDGVAYRASIINIEFSSLEKGFFEK